MCKIKEHEDEIFLANEQDYFATTDQYRFELLSMLRDRQKAYEEAKLNAEFMPSYSTLSTLTLTRNNVRSIYASIYGWPQAEEKYGELPWSDY